jgi:predicted transglutaminase-like cysteine proteinase
MQMVWVHLRRQLAGSWRDTSIAVASVAALFALGGNAAAQATDMPASNDCALHAADRTTQFAAAVTGKPEPAAGPFNTSKASAILGESPSKLDQMRISQTTGEIPATITADMSDGSIGGCAAARSQPSVSDTADPAPFAPENAILGTLSVTIKHSPFDRDWAVVSAQKGSRKIQQTLAVIGAYRSNDEAAQVEAVNRWVNRKIEFGEDRDIYGRADYWAPAAETLRRGIGDCEDFAIAKMELLAALGVVRDKMRLVIARDLVRNADHAVLVVTLSDRMVMLDNMTDRLLDARLPNDYRPIMSFSQNAKWVHGYAAQPVRMASANIGPQMAASRPAEVTTVTTESEMPTLSMALLSVPLVLPRRLSARA